MSRVRHEERDETVQAERPEHHDGRGLGDSGMKLDPQEKKRLAHGIRKWLGDEGYKFFKEIYDEYGELAVCLLIETDIIGKDGKPKMLPHSIHFSEGMEIRNQLRRLTGSSWTDWEYDELWEEITLEAIGVGGMVHVDIGGKRVAGRIGSSLSGGVVGAH